MRGPAVLVAVGIVLGIGRGEASTATSTPTDPRWVLAAVDTSTPETPPTETSTVDRIECGLRRDLYRAAAICLAKAKTCQAERDALRQELEEMTVDSPPAAPPRLAPLLGAGLVGFGFGSVASGAVLAEDGVARRVGIVGGVIVAATGIVVLVVDTIAGWIEPS